MAKTGYKYGKENIETTQGDPQSLPPSLKVPQKRVIVVDS